MDFAGIVEEVGPGVGSFCASDLIFGICPGRRNGAQAEYVCLSESAAIAKLPPNISFEQTPVCEGAFYSTSAEFRQLRHRFDIVYDSVGKMPIRQWRRLVKRDGICATTDAGPQGQNLLAWLGALIIGSKKIRIPVPTRASARLFVAELREMLAEGRFRPVIDRTYRLDDIVDAYRYVETGQKTGIVRVVP